MKRQKQRGIVAGRIHPPGISYWKTGNGVRRDNGGYWRIYRPLKGGVPVVFENGSPRPVLVGEPVDSVPRHRRAMVIE